MATMESEFHPEGDEELGQFKSFFDSIQGTDNPAMEEGWRMGPKGKGGGKGVIGGLGKGKSINSKSTSSKKGQPMSEDAQLKQMQKRIMTLKAWCRSAQTKIKCTLFEKTKLPKKLKTSVHTLLLKINETEQNLCDGEGNPWLEFKADTITNACSVLADFRTIMKGCSISK